MSDDSLNLYTLIARCSEQLAQAGLAFGHGTDNAFDEAAWLVLWSLGLPLDTDLGLTAPGQGLRPVSAHSQKQAQALIDQRISTRQPTAYLTREAWLQGIPFYVDERCIVPRSLIAELIADATLDTWLEQPPTRALDLCTGNGSLAILAAMAWPGLDIDALDISTEALAVAHINTHRHGLHTRIHLKPSDGLAAASPPYDLIMCNPPYVNEAAMQALPMEYRAEPAMALAGGPDGMDFIRMVLPPMAALMSAHAVLVLEIGHERAHFEQAFPSLVHSPPPAVVGLPTSRGDDQVLLLSRSALERLA